MFGWDAILLYLVVAALSVAASALLYQKPEDNNPVEDPDKNKAGKRGVIAPILIGYNKVSPIVAWVGNRRTWEKEVSRTSVLFHSDEVQTITQYQEGAMHILCIGPAHSLQRIQLGGKTIFEGPLDPITHPSGQDVFLCTDEDISTFKIYWGEQDQPINTEMAGHTGVNSRYPFCCYIYWRTQELHSSARWPQLEYVMTCATKDEDADFIEETTSEVNFSATWKEYDATYFISGKTYGTITYDFFTTDSDAASLAPGTVVTISSPAITTKISSVTAGDGGYHILMSGYLKDQLVVDASYSLTFVPLGTDILGANPALAIRQLLFYGYPHGLSFSQSLFDMGSLTTLIDLFSPAGAETSPATIYAKAGRTIRESISGILQDYGIIVYPETTTGLYTFKALRSGDTPSLISDDFLDLNRLQDVKAYSVLAPQKVLYSFLESIRNFTPSTILVDDDGKTSLVGNPQARKINLNTPTDIVTASLIAGRREQEGSIDRTITVPISYVKESHNIGDLVAFDSISGSWRLLSKTTAPDTAQVSMSFMLDAYSIDNNYIQQDTVSGIFNLAAFPDEYLIAFEGNRYLDPNTHGYYVLRQRHDQLVVGAQLWRSETDVTADFVAVQQTSFQSINLLNESLAADANVDTLEITVTSLDFYDFWEDDITDADWRAGANLVLIGDEILSVKSVAEVSDGVFDLTDILRGRFGTTPGAHAVDDEVAFFKKSLRQFVSDELLLAGQSLYLRTQPFTNSNALDLDKAGSTLLSYNGGGYRPLAPDNLNTTNDANAWIAGDDVELRWDYKNASATTGAGFSLSDEPASLALPEGYFKITILNGITVVREEFNILSNTFTYSNADLVSDFVVEPTTFNVQVVEILNGLTSPADAATITRV